MFETSKDILFLVLSICIAFFTVFICIVFFYLIKVLRDLHKTIKEVKEKFDRLQSALETGFNYFGIVTKLGKMAFEHFIDKKSAKRKSKK